MTTRPDADATVHPVDEILPAPRLFALGLQHVLVMYAGAVAVPLILGAALKLPKDQIALLINADLLCCGIVTLIQALGIGPFGIRLPVMMGATFAAVRSPSPIWARPTTRSARGVASATAPAASHPPLATRAAGGHHRALAAAPLASAAPVARRASCSPATAGTSSRGCGRHPRCGAAR